jgi:DNA primase
MACWKCGGHNPIQYIREIENCSYKEALSIVEEYQKYESTEIIEKPKFTGQIELPKEIDWQYRDQMVNYLVSRGFSESIVEKYQLAPCGHRGKYKFKIIIPVFSNKELVSFTTRSYVPNVENAKGHFPGINIKEYLYNVDNFHGATLVIVEGPSDVWAIGEKINNVVGTFGIMFTEKQILKIINLKPSKVFIVYDSEPQALQQAEKLASKLQGFVTTQIIELPEGKDPGDLTDEEIMELKDLIT